MSKLKNIAKAANYKIIPQEDPFKAHTEGFIEGFKYCVEHINELIDLEKDIIKSYNYMGERLFALKMYQERINKALKELEEES